MKGSNKLQQFIIDLAIDKKDHAILGIITGFPMIIIGLILGYFLLADISVFDIIIKAHILGGTIGGLFAILLYGLKEIYHDGKQKKGKKEFLDWWWTSLPVFQSLITMNII